MNCCGPSGFVLFDSALLGAGFSAVVNCSAFMSLHPGAPNVASELCTPKARGQPRIEPQPLWQTFLVSVIRLTVAIVDAYL
jgi:hypothetical protein